MAFARTIFRALGQSVEAPRWFTRPESTKPSSVRMNSSTGVSSSQRWTYSRPT
jgi:hypothetical protein